MKQTDLPVQKTEDLQLTLSKLAHEIRNPLALVSSELQLMSSVHPELCSYEGWDNIMDNLDYIRSLLSELSDYGSAGKLRPVPVSLSTYLHSVAESIRPSMDYLDISFTEEIPPDLPEISADPVRLRQALLNLLRNAQEAVSGPGSRISLQAEQLPSGKISILIKDNGCGLSPQQAETIFSPFVTYKKEGTGLGLAITMEIVKAHCGSLSVESLPGQGSVFRILLG